VQGDFLLVEWILIKKQAFFNDEYFVNLFQRIYILEKLVREDDENIHA